MVDYQKNLCKYGKPAGQYITILPVLGFTLNVKILLKLNQII